MNLRSNFVRAAITTFAVCGSALVAGQVLAATVTVAVAANFAAPMQEIARQFEQATGHRTQISFGSTGKFFAQIKNGAPFDVFLSADDETVSELLREGLGLANTRLTYATGKLILWSRQNHLVDPHGEVLKKGLFTKLAIASPKLAPYGVAAMQVLGHLGLVEATSSKLVYGESIGQTFGFVASGNAELGFVAISQVVENGQIKTGSGWVVPQYMHRALRQDAVLLHRGQFNSAAISFLDFLKNERCKKIIRSYGYQL